VGKGCFTVFNGGGRGPWGARVFFGGGVGERLKKTPLCEGVGREWPSGGLWGFPKFPLENRATGGKGCFVRPETGIFSGPVVLSGKNKKNPPVGFFCRMFFSAPRVF